MSTPTTPPPAPAPASSGASSAPFSGPIIKLGLRSVFGRARVILLAGLPVLLILLTLLIAQADQGPDASQQFLSTFGIGVIAPVVVLVTTTTLINSEFDDGSILYLLIKPVSRTAIVTSKTLVSLIAVVIGILVPMVLAGLLLDLGSYNGFVATTVAALIAGIGYTGVFTMLATLLKRSILGCLAYWLLWESLISGLVPPARWLSVRSWADNAMIDLSTLPGQALPTVPLWYAVSAAVVALVLGVAVAARRLRSVTLSEV